MLTLVEVDGLQREKSQVNGNKINKKDGWAIKIDGG